MLKNILFVSTLLFTQTQTMAMQSEEISTQQLQDKEFVKTLLTKMVKNDQEIRSKIDFANPDESLRQEMLKLDQENTNTLKKILSVYEWIRISQFGEEADNNAWLLVQHADHDPEFQNSVLSKLEQLQKTNETNRRNFAYLYDRVAKNSGKPQRYGTQIDIVDNNCVLYDVEDKEKIDKFRASIELEPIEIYLEMVKQMLQLSK